MQAVRWFPTAAFFLALAACSGNGPSQRGGGEAATVTTTVLKAEPWVDSLQALGTARAKESVTITAKVSETVDKVHFDSGDYVDAGKVLVSLSGKTELAGLNEASANYREAEKLFERQQMLAQRQLIAASLLDTQRAARDAAKARMDQVRAQLSDRVIVAPFDGVLGLRQVSPGSLVTPGTVITTLDDISRIKLDFSIPERFLAALSTGQTVTAHSDTYPGEEFTGVIASMDSRIDPVTRSLTVRADIANPERKLRPGMLLQVNVQQPVRQSLQVPELAVQRIGQQAFLFRVETAKGANQAMQVPVTLGARRPGVVEILDGVKAGDRVVVEGTVKLHSGSRIVEAGAGSSKAQNAQTSRGD